MYGNWRCSGIGDSSGNVDAKLGSNLDDVGINSKNTKSEDKAKIQKITIRHNINKYTSIYR